MIYEYPIIGEVFYYVIRGELYIWTVTKIEDEGTIFIEDKHGLKSHTSIYNWHTLIMGHTLISHKDIVDTYGEEEIFQHLLADTLKDFLLTHLSKHHT